MEHSTTYRIINPATSLAAKFGRATGGVMEKAVDASPTSRMCRIRGAESSEADSRQIVLSGTLALDMNKRSYPSGCVAAYPCRVT